MSKFSPNQNMVDSTVTRRALQVQHVKIKTTKRFVDVEAALERSVSQLDPAIAEALANGDEQQATGWNGIFLFIFLKRDHGALLQVIGQPRMAQYEIGNQHRAKR